MKKIKHVIERIEKAVLAVLAIMLVAAILFGTVDLIFNFGSELNTPPRYMLKSDTLFHMFGEFLIILMGLKLIKLVLLSIPGESSPMMAVIEVALIGVGQKVVTMDVKTQNPSTMLGVAALVFSLSIAYGVCWYIQGKKAGSALVDPEEPSDKGYVNS